MFELAIWKWKAGLYKQFRRRPPFAFILQQEQQALAILLEQIDIPVSTIIDLGTGRGQALSNFHASQFMLGVDQSMKMLAMAHAELPHAHFVCGNACQLPVRDNTADLILAVGLLEYVHEPAHLLCEMGRILKGQAYALVTISPPSMWTSLRRLHGIHLSPTRRTAFKTLVQANHFEMCENKQTMMQQQFLIRKT